MKNKILVLLIVLFGFILIPYNVRAAEKPTIYLFRGKGCPHCQDFIKFLNDINDEYGKYYELKSFEVWYDSDNYELMKSISEFLGQPSKGVPYIIIGKKVIPGYIDSLGDEIKKAIKDLYETKESSRYDVFKEYEKTNKLTKKYESSNLKETVESEGIKYNDPNKKSPLKTSSLWIIIWNLIFTVLGTSAVILFINFKFKKFNENIKTSMQKAEKVTKK